MGIFNSLYRWIWHIHNALFLVYGIIALLLLSACSTVAYIMPQDAHMIPDVPFYAQQEYQCGPASLASVLNYWKSASDPEEIAREIFSTSARGTLTIDMMLYAKKKGFDAEQFKGSMEALRHSVDSGYPLLVLVDYGVSVLQVNHFMVVIGYAKDGVIVHSGKSPNKFLREEDFLSSWEKTNYWMLLIKKT